MGERSFCIKHYTFLAEPSGKAERNIKHYTLKIKFEKTMQKKEYTKPAMKVYELQHRQTILCGSGDDYWGYTAPGIDNDMNHLA